MTSLLTQTVTLTLSQFTTSIYDADFSLFSSLSWCQKPSIKLESNQPVNRFTLSASDTPTKIKFAAFDIAKPVSCSYQEPFFSYSGAQSNGDPLPYFINIDTLIPQITILEVSDSSQWDLVVTGSAPQGNAISQQFQITINPPFKPPYFVVIP